MRTRSADAQPGKQDRTGHQEISTEQWRWWKSKQPCHVIVPKRDVLKTISLQDYEQSIAHWNIALLHLISSHNSTEDIIIWLEFIYCNLITIPLLKISASSSWLCLFLLNDDIVWCYVEHLIVVSLFRLEMVIKLWFRRKRDMELRNISKTFPLWI